MVASGAGTAVAVGDLIFAFIGELSATGTMTTCSDNLGNTYAALTKTVSGSIAYQAYYAYATVAGTLTQVRVAATASTNDAAIVAAVYEGPFKAAPLDKNPANVTSDIVTPFTCPLSTTLAQAAELVICFAGSNGSAVWTATSPLTLDAQQAISTSLSVRIASKKVAATTSTSGDFAGTNPTSAVLGTATFAQATIFADTRVETAAAADTSSAAAILTAARVETAAASDASSAVLGPTVMKVQVSWVEADITNAVFSGVRTESAAPADTAAATLVLAASRSETGAISDSSSAQQVQSPVSRTETAATASTQSATLALAASRSETAATATVEGAALLANVSQIESAAISDVVTAGATLNVSLLENADIADISSVAMLHSGDRVESASISDSSSAEVTTGAIYVKHAGAWKPAVVHVKHEGVWKQARPWIKHEGVWKHP